MSDRQKHDSQIDNSDWVEIWFPIEKDEDGYPESRSWEGLWSSPLEESFEIQSVPFYLKNVSRGDTVNADEGEFLEFAHVAHRGGHNTYRLLMHEASREQVIEALRELESKGLTVELNETGILIAVDVSIAVHQQEIDAYLIAGKEQGRWEMQDGYLHTITVA